MVSIEIYERASSLSSPLLRSWSTSMDGVGVSIRQEGVGVSIRQEDGVGVSIRQEGVGVSIRREGAGVSIRTDSGGIPSIWKGGVGVSIRMSIRREGVGVTIRADGTGVFSGRDGEETRARGDTVVALEDSEVIDDCEMVGLEGTPRTSGQREALPESPRSISFIRMRSPGAAC